MWDGQVPSYRTKQRIGGLRAPYDREAPLYQAIAEMARLRAADPALRRGLQTVRAAAEEPGLFAFTRALPDQAGETLVVFNTGTTPLTANVAVDPASTGWSASRGACPAQSVAPGVVRVSVPPLDYMICVSKGAQ
jgi:hypothetical protein